MFLNLTKYLLLSLFCWDSASGSKRKVPTPVKDEIDHLATANLTRRPLNLYITANGVHSKLETKKIDSSASPNMSYILSVPPFLIKTRGLILIATSRPELYTADRPSIVQMVAASGHKTILIDDNNVDMNNFKDIADSLVSQERTQGMEPFFSLITDDSEIVKRILTKNQLTNLEAVVLIGTNQKDWNDIKMNIPVLILTELDPSSLSTHLYNSQIIHLDKAAMDFERLELMKILQNFLDLLHVR